MRGGTQPAEDAVADMEEAASSRSRSDAVYLALLATCVSIAAFAYFFRHHEILLYGDATAHIHIARRVFDSRTPGPMQLGTVWLPLPHLLIVPFILSSSMWRSGLGGSIPSMAAYVAGVIGIFRLVRSAAPGGRAARMAAWCAALAYALNPNLLYLQATAMTEPLYMALFVWATVYLAEFVHATEAAGLEAQQVRTRSLNRCGWLLLLAMLTRYDGWFAAMAFALAVLLVTWRWRAGRTSLWRSPLRPAFMKCLLLLAVAPVLWFAYNAWNWGNPLEFATGPYSARAIEAHADRPGGWHYPGWHAPRTAATYFMKSAKLNVAGGVPQRETEHAPRWRLEALWFPLAMAGAALLLAFARGLWPSLMLWLPLPFYSLSIAWGGVPIFLPIWWPYSYYNVRYGLQLLPGLAVLMAAIVYVVGVRVRKPALLATVAVLLMALVMASYYVAWRATPVCLREAQVNNATRVPFDRAVARELEKLPPGATVLMYTASHAAALQFAGFPLRRTINETNNKIWQAALAAPGKQTDFVVAFESPDDPVWRATQEHVDDLRLLSIVEGWREPRAYFYQRKLNTAQVPLPEAPAAQGSTPANHAQEPKAAEEQKQAEPGSSPPRARHHRPRRRL